MKHLLCLNDWTTDEILDTLALADKLKQENKKGIEHHLLKGKTLGMIFSKSSTRTRVSFEVGMTQLGGYPLFLSANDIQLGRGETVHDTAKTLSRFLDGIMIRTFSQQDVADLAKYGSVPVINALTDLYHPCQILADLQTIKEHKGALSGLKLAYVGDGNNVCNSLLFGCSKVGMDIAVATPKGYGCMDEIVEAAKQNAAASKSSVTITNDPFEAAKGADVIYTDTWISMGQEAQKEEKVKLFGGYQVNAALFEAANPDAIFMHCLPAYRGFEVSEEIIDGPKSVVFDEAENRLHAQKAVMVKLMGDGQNE